MQSSTDKQLYDYWDRVRNGRIAPNRAEIEPAAIAPLLAETFIVEYAGPGQFRFRLAGTRICDQFGRELRGTEFLALWDGADRHAMTSLLANLFGEGAVGHVRFQGLSLEGRHCNFSMLLLPLTATSHSVNRCLGSITALEPHYWLGADPIVHLDLTDVALDWPMSKPAAAAPAMPAPGNDPGFAGSLNGRPRFKVYDGGLSQPKG
ncbi:PAS domain-containing protein [Methyloligella solikamskensis]|uniref:PAS domain-containing protein n=1 Tax=Methyloligella solikamskensis TaxID=1177756 RepID=A0ABW3JB54_9HYPH